MTATMTVAAYIAKAPPAARRALKQLRAVIKAAAPFGTPIPAELGTRLAKVRVRERRAAE